MTRLNNQQRQADLVLNALKAGPCTIWQLTEGLRISRPGARIFELKKKYVITDEWKDVQGRRVKVYTLEGHSEPLPDATPVPCVPVRSHGMFTRWCDGCQKPFQSVRARKRFCSNTCRTRRWKQQNLFAEEPNATSTIRA